MSFLIHICVEINLINLPEQAFIVKVSKASRKASSIKASDSSTAIYSKNMKLHQKQSLSQPQG